MPTWRRDGSRELTERPASLKLPDDPLRDTGHTLTPPDRRPQGSPLTGAAAHLPSRISLVKDNDRSEEHTSELQSLMRISYAVFCLKKKTNNTKTINYLKTSIIRSY